VLVQQQQQEILFYMMAWSVALGLWSKSQPLVLFWALLLAGLISLRTAVPSQDGGEASKSKKKPAAAPDPQHTEQPRAARREEVTIRIDPKKFQSMQT